MNKEKLVQKVRVPNLNKILDKMKKDMSTLNSIKQFASKMLLKMQRHQKK
jgi:hypothetical protein